MKVSDAKILKAVLMLRRCGNKYQSKEEQIAEQKEWVQSDRDYAERFDEWIDSLRAELAKTKEEREEEGRRFCERLAELEAEMEFRERMSWKKDRDEWDDYWEDAARSVGAVSFC